MVFFHPLITFSCGWKKKTWGKNLMFLKDLQWVVWKVLQGWIYICHTTWSLAKEIRSWTLNSDSYRITKNMTMCSFLLSEHTEDSYWWAEASQGLRHRKSFPAPTIMELGTLYMQRMCSATELYVLFTSRLCSRHMKQKLHDHIYRWYSSCGYIIFL